MTQEMADASWASGSDTYIFSITNDYLKEIGGNLAADTMDRLTANQHTLLAYRILLDEVRTGGFIQLIQNGYGPYVLAGPFAMMMKKEWGFEDFGKFIYKVRKEYLTHKEELEQERDEEGFMAMYEEFDRMNNYGDDFLDLEEELSPLIADYVRQNEKKFILFTNNGKDNRN